MKRAKNQPEGSLCLYAGIFAKTWTIADRGTLLPQHSHTWPHISYVVCGAVRVWCEDQHLGEFVGPCAIKIPALAKHKFLTLSDNVVILCIHNADRLDDDEPVVAERHNLEMED